MFIIEKIFLALATLATFAVHHVSEYKSTHLEAPQDNLFQTYEQWKSDYNQNFNESEEEYRFSVFKANLELIGKFNTQQDQQNGSDLRLGLGPFTALTLEEFVEKHVGNFIEYKQESSLVELKDSSPTTTTTTTTYSNINWKDKGAVTPVEYQGQCGSCWAFAAKGSLEGLNAVTNGVLEPLSAQQLIDCSQSYGTSGCQGGDQIKALQYTKDNGIQLQSDYPYISGSIKQALKCKYNPEKVAFKNNGYVRIPKPNQKNMYQALAQQPINTVISGSNYIFQHYNSGTVKASDGCPTNIDHGVLIVGYSAEYNYWNIKNSWGTSWGENGYIKIEAQTSGIGVCGVQQYVNYPTL